MLTIPLLAIINAAYGRDAFPNWLLPFLVFIAVLATSDPATSAIWAVAFCAIRMPALSKRGFYVFSWRDDKRVFWDAAKYLLTRSKPYAFVALLVYLLTSYQVFLWVAIACLTYGLPYIVIGRVWKEMHQAPLKAEFAAGAWVGLLMLFSTLTI